LWVIFELAIFMTFIPSWGAETLDEVAVRGLPIRVFRRLLPPVLNATFRFGIGVAIRLVGSCTLGAGVGEVGVDETGVRSFGVEGWEDDATARSGLRAVRVLCSSSTLASTLRRRRDEPETINSLGMILMLSPDTSCFKEPEKKRRKASAPKVLESKPKAFKLSGKPE
jgi:hypothetical protein